MNKMNDVNTKTGPGRWSVIFVVLAFILPLAAAWVAYIFYEDEIRAMGTTNYGILVYPPIELRLKDFHAGSESVDGEQYFSGMWTYLYFDRSDCDDQCVYNLYRMRQVHIGQGPEQSRVQRMMVLSGGLNEPGTEKIRSNYPRLKLAVADSSGFKALLSQIDQRIEGEGESSQRIYLVDPNGHLMMYYEPTIDHDGTFADAKKMHKDLKKLLKISKTK